MKRWGLVTIILIILTVIGSTGVNAESVNNNGSWDKYEGIKRYEEIIGGILPFKRKINEEVKQRINPDTLPHTTKMWKKEYKLRKGLGSIRAIEAESEYTIDTMDTTILDTFGLHYGVAVGKDTTFGILAFTVGKDIISILACKVYQDSLGRLTEEAAMTKEGSREIINAKVRAMDDSLTLIHGIWIFRDTTRGLKQIFEGDINTESEEVPVVYEEMSNFVGENNFFYVDPTKTPPLELLDEFCREVLGEEKATQTNYAYVALSALCATAISTEIPGGWGLIAGISYSVLNQAIMDFLNNLPPRNP